MKLLVAMAACQDPKYAEMQQTCRDTWVARWGHLVDIRFFVGNPAGPERDRVVYLDCPDTWIDLPLKTWELMKWAKTNDYTHVFKCDDDSWVHIPRLLASGSDKEIYTGRQASAHTYNFCQGGAGYWLSGRALDIVCAAPHDYWTQRNGLHRSCEDMAVALLLKHNGIQPRWDNRYFHGITTTNVQGRLVTGTRPGPENDLITAHKCSPKIMREIYASFE